MNTIKYKIVSVSEQYCDLDNLQYHVNQYCNDGWVPVGGIFNTKGRLGQPMLKYPEVEEKLDKKFKS
jgi:hypothetical protein